tara:strand:+ start:222 stop:1157 length:936 start_codon:yes stop_codon:yes gene_type:complete
MTKVSVVVPVYNEELNISEFYERTKKTLLIFTENYEIIFVLDPSKDNSEEMIKNYSLNDNKVKLIKFSRRFGQPIATLAGIEHSNGDFVIVIDADLQDPPELIKNLYEKISTENFDVVYAKRKTREGETIFKKIISSIGYRVINLFSDVNIPRDVGDFRIMSKRVVEEIKKFKETSAFLRGMVSYVGFKQSFIEYDRDRRLHGDGNYNKYLGSLKIGLNGLVGFTSRPLQLMSVVGFIFSLISFVIGFTYLILKILNYEITAGLPTTILVITFFSGIQLMALGLVGEYIGRIYDEVKRRPRYIIEKKINLD